MPSFLLKAASFLQFWFVPVLLKGTQLASYAVVGLSRCFDSPLHPLSFLSCCLRGPCSGSYAGLIGWNAVGLYRVFVEVFRACSYGVVGFFGRSKCLRIFWFRFWSRPCRFPDLLTPSQTSSDFKCNSVWKPGRTFARTPGIIKQLRFSMWFDRRDSSTAKGLVAHKLGSLGLWGLGIRFLCPLPSQIPSTSTKFCATRGP